MVGVRHLDQVGVDAAVAQGLRESPSYCRVDGGVPGAVDDGDGDLVVLVCQRERVGLRPSLRALGPAAVEEAAQEVLPARAFFVEVDGTGEGDQRVRPQ